MGDILNIGVSGLNAIQNLLSTVSHNISNAAVEGFSRQTTELLTQTPQLDGASLVGAGVRVGGTNRVVNETLVGVHRDNISNQSQLDSEVEFAEQIDLLVAGDETGASSSITDFFNAIHEVAKAPGSTTQREVLLQKSQAMVSSINTLDKRFDDTSEDINTQIAEAATKINSLAASLVKINRDVLISSNLGAFTSPNDLLDERDRILNKIAELTQITTIKQNNGAIDAFIGNGQGLVVGGVQTVLSTERDPDDVTRLRINATSGVSSQNVTNVVVGGKIGGLMNVRNNFLDVSRAKLGRIALTMGLTINAQHQLGIDRNGDLGGRYFNDFNTLTMQLQRSVPNDLNTGTAIFSVAIDDIPRPEKGPFTVYGASSSLVDTGTLDQLNTGELTINGMAIRATAAGDDTVSTVDSLTSAIATAAAINASASGAGITAKAEINNLCLGTFSTGPYIAGEFQINGTNIITVGTDEATLLRDINALTATTGVRAVGDGSLGITLVAEDGRNIQLTSNATATAPTFQYFNTASTTVFNQVQRAGVSLTHVNSPIVISGADPTDVGLTAGTTPAVATSLTDSEYELAYDGTNYTLTRKIDSVQVASSTTTTLTADGMTITLNNGTAVAGDKFLIRPTASASKSFALNITSQDKLAMASPIRMTKTISNTSSVDFKIGKILNTTGTPAPTPSILGNAFGTAGQLTPPIRIDFINDASGNTTKYRVFDISGATAVQIGPDQTFVPNQDNEIFPITAVVNKTLPGPNATVVYDPGYRITVLGEPVDGDSLTIDYNTNGLGDSKNAEEMLSMQFESLLAGGTVSYQGAYSELVARVGSLTQTTEVNFAAAQSLLRESEGRLQSISGVNLDEEATKLIRFQQNYRAAAQVITIGGSLFDTLLDAVRRS